MSVPPEESPHERITGLEPGGGVPPGETPPAEGSESWAGGRAYKQPDVGDGTLWNRVGAVAVICSGVLVGVLIMAWVVVRLVEI